MLTTAPHCPTLNSYKQQGTVLATALLYLAVLTLLAATALATSSLQTKLNQHYFQATEAFENAEATLVMIERLIQPGQQQGEGVINNQTRYHFSKLASTHPCIDNYIVNVTNETATSKVSLGSIWQLPVASFENVFSEGCFSDAFIAERITWWQTN